MESINNKKKKFILKSQYTIPIVLLVMWVILSIMTPNFVNPINIRNLFRASAIYGIVSIGVTYIIIAGHADLSVGAVMGLSGMIVTYCMTNGVSIFLSIVIALLAAMIVGLINGLVVYLSKIPSFIATLGSMTAVRGVAQLVSNGQIIGNLPDAFRDFAGLQWLGIPSLVWILFIMTIIGQFVLSKTIYGRNLYAVGSNQEVARLSSISVSKTVVSVFVLSSLCAGIAGVLFASRLAQGLPTTGTGYELEAIAASVIGGASFMGGEGTVIGTIFGALIMTTLRNGGNLLKVNSFWLSVIIGIMTVVAVVIDTQRKRRKG